MPLNINEFEDHTIFTELGHNVISTCAYIDPRNPTDDARPAIPGAFYDPELSELAKVLQWPNWGREIPKRLIDWADLIYILGLEVWLPSNWELMKHKHVVWRSNGQSIESTERVLSKFRPEGLRIIRYSPFEPTIPGYVGADALIRFWKDENEYKDWNGETEQVITVAQSMKKRNQYLKYYDFVKATEGLPRKLYGKGNNDTGILWGGLLNYEQLKKVYRDNRVFFYTCTYPAQYTMGFIESWISGQPVVAIGSARAGYNIEVPHLLENGVDGFTSDSIYELRGYVTKLMKDYDLAKSISAA